MNFTVLVMKRTNHVFIHRFVNETGVSRSDHPDLLRSPSNVVIEQIEGYNRDNNALPTDLKSWDHIGNEPR
jgi:hypothetical protein